MKKGMTYEAVVEELEYGGKAKVLIEGEEVEVKNVLPGQKVLVRITKKRRTRTQGKVLEILETSPLEVEETCKHFGKCGGCFMQSIPYEKQLAMKEKQVLKLLEEREISIGEILPAEKSPKVYEYRNKMEFTFGDEEKGGKITLGMHKKGRHHDVVTVDGCRIMDEDFRKIQMAVLDFAKERNLPQYNSMKHEGYLRHLVVRKGFYTGEIVINLVTSTQRKEDFMPLVETVKNLELEGHLHGFLHSKNDQLADMVQSDEMIVLHGKPDYTDRLFDLEFQISPYSFFQTNTLGAEVLYQNVVDFIGEIGNKVVYDLYCGTGTIAQVLAKNAKKVIGVEIVEEAVKKAKENAALNGIDNCEFIAGDVKKVLSTIEEKPDTIVVDPPREGIHPKAVKDLIDFNVEEIVYVSCNPKSLAENLTEFQNAGYRVRKLKAVDLFPHTSHVECVVLMSRVDK